MMKRDVDYVVKDGQVVIVDEFTGRLMTGRRYSEGLHQAIEAKEHVKVERESKTLATITFQNYFRMYKKLSGMTGTAKTEEDEFLGIYKLDVVVIPTNKPMIREDRNDAVYTTEKGKFQAVAEEVEKRYKTGQPVLVGTVSVEKSELVSSLLDHRGVPHVVLNAKFHEKEAEIIAQAGKKGAITIATNMAGRGTDILLGGNPEFMARHRMKQLGYDEALIEEAIGHARKRARRGQGSPEALQGPLRPVPRRNRQGARGGHRPRRPAHHRHRAARVPPHRQPAARSFRTPRRPGLQPVLHLAGRRFDAPLRLRPHPAA